MHDLATVVGYIVVSTQHCLTHICLGSVRIYEVQLNVFSTFK